MAAFLNGHNVLAKYFIYAANNIPITLLFTLIAKIGTLIGIKNITLLLNIFQCMLLDLAILAIIFILKRENKKNEASYLLLIYALYSPISVFGVNIYTDVTSACFAIYGAFLFYLYLKNNNYYLLILSGVIEALAYLIKMNLVVMSIGIIILIIISEYKPLKTIKVLSIFVLSFALIVGAYKFGTYNLQKRSFTNEQISKSSFPYTYWISMGLNTQTYGQHGFNNINLWNEGAQQKTLQNRKKYFSAKIKSQLSQAKIKGLVKLYLEKTNVMYSQGELGTIERSFGISRNMEGPYQYIVGAKKYVYTFYSQVIYIFILLTALLYSIKQTLKSSVMKIGYFEIISVFFIGIFLFHILMWEVMPRYAFVAIFALLPISAAGGINDPLTEIIKNKYSAYTLVIICGILMLIQLPAINRKLKQQEAQINDRTVLSQIIPDHSLVALSIPKNKAIEETVVINSKFRKVNLISWAGGQTIEEDPNLKLQIY